MDLPDRMKAYELEHRASLPPRTWTILRLDGRAFGTWTRGLQWPYSTRFIGAMGRGMAELCESLSGTVIGYAASDEISLVLTDFAKPDTEPMFGGQVQKLVSISASILTAHFARSFIERDVATFDARVFTLPYRDEVRNYLLWRQASARNNARNTLEARGGAPATADPRFVDGQTCHRTQAFARWVWEVQPAPTLDCQPGTFLEDVLPAP
ncbi:hypothetical protein OJ998_24035 [Solirubrobacter taibaiensis]|nr:hypothetical protein [Solirubrobacter taibaiensis]